MDHGATFEDVRRAWKAGDSELSDLVVALATAPAERPPAPGTPPPREGAPTYAAWLSEIKSRYFARKPQEEQARLRVEGMKALEAADVEVPLPDRVRLHEIVLGLWADASGGESFVAREALLAILARVPLVYGPWRALKRIFKEAEAKGDLEVLGVLTARFDAAFATGASAVGDVSRITLGYLVRRGWRALRRRAEALPATYADAAVLVLSAYGDETSWSGTWVANHILYHDTKKYSRRRFTYGRRTPGSFTQHRYAADLWRRSPRPLFTLLERARSEQARAFATASLKADFRAVLREVDPAWVVRLMRIPSAAIHELVVWLLGNSPSFDQASFRKLGLHEPVLDLLESPSNEARAYAAAYARAHARDIELDRLIRLANNTHPEVQKLARDLLADRDPRKDVGLDAWGLLLGTPMGHELAATALRKHFGAKELSPAWFKERLLSDNAKVFELASELLPKVHAVKDLGPDFFRDVCDDERLTGNAARFALAELSRFPMADVGVEFLRRALLHPVTSGGIRAWIAEDRVAPRDLGAGYWKALGYEPSWKTDPWINALLASGRSWAKSLAWNSSLSDLALSLLRDVRKFSPDELGFEWLMQLAARTEESYRSFAVDYIAKAFVPADFAPKEEAPAAAKAAPKAADLGGKSFLFTGKLATMQRGDAQKKVTGANGKNASSVNAKLDYLVIGDEGSPLYGAGKKGSKQVDAEKLVAQGAPIKIISETAFLQMLAGEERTFSAGSIERGCERLWSLLTEPGAEDLPLRKLALQYMRRHHPDICLAETDRPVDPGAEIPASFLTFERMRPLFFEARATLRAFALDVARWELSRWSPKLDALLDLCEGPHADVRAFVEKALFAGAEKEHDRYRIPRASLTADGVYLFCESQNEAARRLGMKLLTAHAHLAAPAELFRLSESPDRQIVAMVIKTLWSLYRDKHMTRGWKPAPGAVVTVGKKGEKAAEIKPVEAPPARPSGRPASDQALYDFLRRALFTIPPGRMAAAAAASAAPATSSGAASKPGKRVRPLPTRRSKIMIIESMRDLAIEDAAFAGVVGPLFDELLASSGASERAACLVAKTRIHKARRAD